MSMALQLQVKEQGEQIAALRARCDGLADRCEELSRRLDLKLLEAVDETLAAAPIPIPPLAKSLKALGIGLDFEQEA